MRTALFLVTCLTLALYPVHGLEVLELLKKIDDAKSSSIQAFTKDDGDLPSNLIVASASSDASTAGTALITYWLYGGESSTHAELIWWRSKTPALRALAAALLLTGRKENTSNVPWLDCTRFNDKERQQREQELQLIEKSDKQLGAALKRLVEVTFSANPNPWKDALELRFSAY